ncbi:AMP-binding protein [Rhodococcus qingshengii]|uniref:AMP-binding protein n=1 Tax=Rhodococcus qingshengii TaxID=334542 RepID=UPI003FA37EE8
MCWMGGLLVWGGGGLVCGGVVLSWGEFDVRVNRFARFLISLGVGPESRVCVALSRSVEFVGGGVCGGAGWWGVCSGGCGCAGGAGGGLWWGWWIRWWCCRGLVMVGVCRWGWGLLMWVVLMFRVFRVVRWGWGIGWGCCCLSMRCM